MVINDIPLNQLK